MKIELTPGKYVVAVSGGIDSMVLLHVLCSLPGYELTVAHFDHGMRATSAEDRKFVEATAREYGLPFVCEEGRLGQEASEATARKARYDFLHRIRLSSGARAIITAHHHDDVLETAIINLIRGTGRKGLASLRSTEVVKRPLLGVSKQNIEEYASQHKLVWREDETNSDTRYLRNHVRQVIMPRLGITGRQRLGDIIARTEKLNDVLDSLLDEYLNAHIIDGNFDRGGFASLPQAASKEVMAAWLRRNDIRNFDAKTIERLVQAAKIKAAGKQVDISRGFWLIIGKDTLALKHRER